MHNFPEFNRYHKAANRRLNHLIIRGRIRNPMKLSCYQSIEEYNGMRQSFCFGFIGLHQANYNIYRGITNREHFSVYVIERDVHGFGTIENGS